MAKKKMKKVVSRSLKRTEQQSEIKQKGKGNRKYRDTVFRKLFSEKDKIIELYNALEGTHYGLDTKVEIQTLEGVLFVDRENDLCFTIDDKYIVMGEHQSTINPNIPLRNTVYFGRTFEHLIDGENIYGEKLVKIPTPEFYLMYNGTKKWETELLRLSKCFISPAPENSMELVVKVVNVAYNEDSEILKRSETLRGYSLLIHYIQMGMADGLELGDAIDSAIRHCIDEGILEDFLRKYGREIGDMLYDEVTWEDVVNLRADQAYERGFDEGRNEERVSMIDALISYHLKSKTTAEDIIAQLVEIFQLSNEEAKECLNRVKNA